jgi:NAD(P)-dependent dehydrogenase (short-subunit alcohol dehydrogenase family)
MRNYGLAGRVVVVTGGASGIGLASAAMLIEDGASVAILDVNREQVEHATQHLNAKAAGQARAAGYVIDVRNVEDVYRAAETVERDMGRLWGVVAAAGISGSCRSEDLSLQELTDVFAVNVHGVLTTCQAFGRQMLANAAGSIVLVGSVASLGGQPGRLPYNASKHAVAGIVRTLAIEWGRRGVRVNGVAPGPVDTPLLRRGVPVSFFDNVYNDRTPLGRLARPEEVASAILMLLSDASSFVHGVMLPVDGGLMAGPFTHRQGEDMGSNRLLDAGVYREA